MALKKLTTLEPREYEHPFDKKALDALERTKGLDTLVKKFYEYGIEHIFTIQYTGSNLKVTATSFPVIGDCVKPSMACPVATMRPSIFARSMIGRPSGVTGRRPDHASSFSIGGGVFNTSRPPRITAS